MRQFYKVLIIMLMIQWEWLTIYDDDDDEQTSSDLSRTAFLTWCDKHNIVQFSRIRFPFGCGGDGICSLLSYEFIKRIYARASMSYMLIKSFIHQAHHSINIQKESILNCVLIYCMRKTTACCVQLTLYGLIERLVRVDHQRTVLLSYSVNQPWCKSNFLLIAARIHTFVFETIARAFIISFSLFIEAYF
jgi:hypothetical protein